MVLRDEAKAGPCSLCGDPTGPGVIAARGDDRFCDVCALDQDRRLGMLLFLAAFSRTFTRGSAQSLEEMDELECAFMLAAIARLYDLYEAQHPDRPFADWFRPVAGARRVLVGLPTPNESVRASGISIGETAREGLQRRVEAALLSTLAGPVAVDDVLVRLAEAASSDAEVEKVLIARRSRGGAITATALLADEAALDEPDDLALALAVHAVDVGGLEAAWERRDAAEALAWLILGNPLASARVRRLFAEAGKRAQAKADPGVLLLVAKLLA